MKQRSGQTLLELVIAAGVISVSVVAALTLIIRTIDLAQQSQQTVEAGNYAREGVEIVRMIRDSNWLAIDDNATGCGSPVAWDSDGTRSGTVCSPMSGQYVANFIPGTGWSLEKCNGSCTTTQQQLYRKKNSNSYTVQSSQPIDTNIFSSTQYRRLIEITKKTADVKIPPNAPSPWPTVEYLEVQVTVAWTGVRPRSVVMKEDLYQWR